MIPHLIFITWLALGTGDMATTHVGLTAGAHEADVLLPQNKWAIDALILGTNAAGGYLNAEVWRRGHRKTALLLLFANITIKAWVIHNNLQVIDVQRQYGR